MLGLGRPRWRRKFGWRNAAAKKTAAAASKRESSAWLRRRWALAKALEVADAAPFFFVPDSRLRSELTWDDGKWLGAIPSCAT